MDLKVSQVVTRLHRIFQIVGLTVRRVLHHRSTLTTTDYSFYSNTGTNSVRFYGYASTTSTNSADGDTLAVFSPRIAGLSGNDKQVIFNVRTSSSVAYYTTKMIIATADSNASMGSIHIVDTVNYSNVYQEFTVDLDNVPTNASRVVFYVVPEFVSGYTYAYTTLI